MTRAWSLIVLRVLPAASAYAEGRTTESPSHVIVPRPRHPFIVVFGTSRACADLYPAKVFFGVVNSRVISTRTWHGSFFSNGFPESTSTHCVSWG